MDLNKVMLIGRITVDLEVKKIWESGNSVLNFVLATNRVYKTKDWAKVEEAEFHRCVVFGRLAEIMWEYLGKWRQVYVEWRLRTRQWEDQAGNRRHSTEIVVNEMTFCDNKWGKSNNTESRNKDENEEDVPF